jgi:hypothetical protein
MRVRRFIFGALVLLLFTGCAHGGIVDGVFVSRDYRFSVDLPGPPYEQIGPKGALVAVTDPATGISAAVAASPDPYPETADGEQALDYIARDLFFFLTKKEYRLFEETTLSGATARHVVLTGFDDDSELVFSAYVAREYGTIYDIVVWCPPRYQDEAAAMLKTMADSFTFLTEGGR